MQFDQLDRVLGPLGTYWTRLNLPYLDTAPWTTGYCEA